MFKIFRRFVAYFIDMLVVLIIVQAVSSLPFNKELDKYNKAYDNYVDSFSIYSDFFTDLDNYYEDEELDSEEYEKLIEDNSAYEELVNKYYKNGKLSTKNYDKLVSELEETYLEEYEESSYKIDKYSRFFNSVYFVVIILYFVVFNFITNGATLGKKLVRLRIVNSKDKDNKVGIVSYLIRCVMLYQPIYYLFKVIFVNILSVGTYNNVSSIIYDIHSYLLFIILTFVIVRLDGRGLHDIAAGTEVISLKKEVKEVE